MKILITGANGFIGSRLAEYLSQKGHDVVQSGRQAQATAPGWGTYLPAELTLEADCERLVKGVEAVIHAAGKAGAWGSLKSYVDANVKATDLLLEACRRAGVKRFINLSSSSISFDFRDQLDLDESFLPPRFSNAYAQTKHEAEQRVLQAHSRDLWTLSLRPRGVLGAGDRNWLPRIIELRQKNRLVQVGSGRNRVDFTSVVNLCYAIDLALHASQSSFGEVYNITNGESVVLWDFVEEALERLDLDGNRRKVPLAPMMMLARANEVFHRFMGSEKEPLILPLKIGVAAYSMTLNIEKIKQRLGYRPQQSTEEALQEFVVWWKRGLKNPS